MIKNANVLNHWGKHTHAHTHTQQLETKGVQEKQQQQQCLRHISSCCCSSEVPLMQKLRSLSWETGVTKGSICNIWSWSEYGFECSACCQKFCLIKFLLSQFLFLKILLLQPLFMHTVECVVTLNHTFYSRYNELCVALPQPLWLTGY